MALDFHQLRAFLAVVDAGSIGRASQTLNTTQPSLSRLLRRLEAQLDVELFERRTTGMDLTSYGQALLPHARALIAESKQAEEDLAALRGASRGTVRLGAVPSAARTIIPLALGALLQRSPGLRVKIIEAVAETLADALTNRTIDLVVASDLPECDELRCVAATGVADRHVVVAAADHPLVSQTQVSLNDVLCENWVQPPRDTPARRQFEHLLITHGMPLPQTAIETHSPDTIKAIVAHGRYLGWLPVAVVAAEVTQGQLAILPVEALTWSREFLIYRRRAGALSVAATQMLGAMKALPD